MIGLSDVDAMHLALEQARLGLGRAWPNPSVGCVIVKNGRVMARARTADGGRPHAETQALMQAGSEARGSTLYVTLEPCHTTGRTGPCTQAIIDAGVARIVIACRDPFQVNAVGNHGMDCLRSVGIGVETGLLADEAASINEGFFSTMRLGRPLMAAKIASSMDGKIASASAQSQWITGEAARLHGHYLRSIHDAVVTGIGTVVADDPMLTVRHNNTDTWQPVRVVIDPSLRISLESQLVRTACDHPVWILTRDLLSDKALALQGLQVRLVAFDDDWPRVLAQEGITRLLVEAGPGTLSPLMRAGWLDRLYWFQAPIVLGASGRDAFDATINPPDLNTLARWRIEERHVLGPDLLHVFQIHPSCAKAP